MSKRRHAGEIVWKPAGFGYYQHAGFGRITEAGTSAKCTVCDDPGCREWPVLLRLVDKDGAYTGSGWYYVCECEMVDPECEAAAAATPAHAVRKVSSAA